MQIPLREAETLQLERLLSSPWRAASQPHLPRPPHRVTVCSFHVPLRFPPSAATAAGGAPGMRSPPLHGTSGAGQARSRGARLSPALGATTSTSALCSSSALRLETLPLASSSEHNPLVGPHLPGLGRKVMRLGETEPLQNLNLNLNT